MSAIALGAHVENDCGSWSSPLVRITKAFARLWPELTTPRSSSLSLRKVSASSMTSVGCHFSIARNRAAAVMLDAATGLGTSAPIRVRSVVFPHSGVGEVAASSGEIVHAS